MKMKNRLLALLLCAVMCLSLFPAGAFAEDGGEATEEPAAAVEVSEQPEEELSVQPEEELSVQLEETPDQPTDGSDGTPSADPAAETPEGGPAEGPTEGVDGGSPAGETGQVAPEDPSGESADGAPSAEGEESPAEGTNPAGEEGEEDGSAEETAAGEDSEEAGGMPDGEEEEEDETVTPASVTSELQAAIDAAKADGKTFYTLDASITIDGDVDASGITIVIPAGVTLTIGVGARLTVTDFSIQDTQNARGHIVVEVDKTDYENFLCGELVVAGRIDLGDKFWIWDDWVRDGSFMGISYDEAVPDSGFTVECTITSAGADESTGLLRVLEAEMYMTDDHMFLSATIPSGTSIDTDAEIMVNTGVTMNVAGELNTTAIVDVNDDGVLNIAASGSVTAEGLVSGTYDKSVWTEGTVNVAGTLYARNGIVVAYRDEDGELNVTGSGKVQTDGPLSINTSGAVTLEGSASVSALTVPDGGQIRMDDDSRFTLSDCDWTDQDELTRISGCFILNDYSAVECVFEAYNVEDFYGACRVCQALGNIFYPFGDHVSGRIRAHCGVDVVGDLNTASPKPIAIEIRGDSDVSDCVGSLTVAPGVTFTAGALELYAATMTVEGTLVTTDELRIEDDATYGAGKLIFKTDKCYVNEGGSLFVCDTVNPDAHIAGLTMTRFETADQTEGRRYVDTGNYDSDYEDSTALLAAIAGGTDFTVRNNTIIQDGETVDASGIKISVAAGVTLLVKGKLTVGDFEIGTDAQGEKGCISVPMGGNLHMTAWTELDIETWTAWGQDGSAKCITFADGAGLIVDLGDCVTMTSLTAALDDAAQALTNSGANRAHLRFELGIPAGTDIDTGSTAITIPSGVTLNIDTGAALTVGANGLTVTAGAIVLNRGSLISSGTVTVETGGVFTMKDTPEEGFAADVTLGAGGKFLVSGTLNPDGSSTVFLAYAESIAAAMATVSGVPVGILNIDAGAGTAAGFTALWTEALNYPDVGTLNLCLEGIDITFGTDIGVDVPSNVCLVVNEGSSLTVPETDPATEVNLNGAIAMEGGSFVNKGTLNVRGFVNFQRRSSEFVNNGVLNVSGGIGVHSMHGDTTATLTDNGTLNILEGGYIEPAVTVIGSHVHRYTLSGWIWTDISEEEETSGKTGYRAEAAFICKNCLDITRPNASIILPAEVTETDSDGVTVYTATVRGSDGKTYSDSKVIGFVISGLEDTYYYTGNAIRPVITVTYKGRLLSEYKDFSVSYKNNIKVGTATVTVRGYGNYSSDSKNMVTKTFEIIPPPQTPSDPTAVLVDYDTFKKAKIASIPAETFHNCFITPEPVVTVNGEPLSKDNYTVSYSNNWNAGTATVAITNFGDKQKTIKKTFKINPYNLADGYRNGEITVDQIPDTSIIKNGTNPEPVVKFGDVVLVPGRDYTPKYMNNKKDGTGKIKIDGKWNYRGRIEIEYKILKTDLGSGQIIMTVADCAAGTKMSKAMGIVKLLDLDSGTLGTKDYTLEFTYEDGTVVNKSDKPSAGTRIIVTATGQGMYTGTLVSSFRVVEGSAKDISKAKVTFRKDIEYTGSPVILGEGDFTITMKKGQPNPTLGKDFIITGYTNNVNKGKAQVVFRGIGDYCGTKTLKFKITTSKIIP